MVVAAVSALVAVANVSAQADPFVIRQITNSFGGQNSQAALSADGRVVVYVSDRNPGGGNADGNPEVFRFQIGGGLTQVTSTAVCTNSAPSVTDDGKRVAFASDCNTGGGNGDGNRELFMWTQGSSLVQLTSTSGCNVARPDLDRDGSHVAFDSTCNITGDNPDASREVFLWTASGHVQVTSALGACASTEPSVNGDGSRIMYSSDCNPTGGNADSNREVFLWQQGLGLTQVSTSAVCINSQPDLDEAGSRAVLRTDCNLTGANADGSEEVVAWLQGSGFTGVTNGVGCSSSSPRVSREGRRAALQSDCDLVGGNVDANHEAFYWRQGTPLRQVTNSTACSVAVTALSDNGLHAGLSSNCDLSGQNFDANPEVFVASAPSPSLSAIKSVRDVEGSPTAPGDVMEYVVVITNNGTATQPDNAGPEFTDDLPPELAAVSGTCAPSTGSCFVAGNHVEWSGSLGVQSSVTIVFRARVRGGLAQGTSICNQGRVHFDADLDGRNESRVLTDDPTSPRTDRTCFVLDQTPAAVAGQQLAAQAFVPVLNYVGQDEVCDTIIEVQNVGTTFSKAVMVVFGAPGLCPPQCSGPLKVECSGLLKPGAAWKFLGSQVPGGAKSANVFSISAATFREVGLEDLFGFDDIIGEYFCETLFHTVVGNCDNYRRFQKAFIDDGLFGGFPIGKAVGQPIAVEVLRRCPGAIDPQVTASSMYAATSGTYLGSFDPVFGGYAFYAPLLYAQRSNFTSIMYIQNAGLDCTVVEVWFKRQDNCLRAQICEIFTLAPGETLQFDAAACVSANWLGSAWLRSQQPLAVVIDHVGADALMSYEGFPSQLSFVFNGVPSFTTGSQVSYAPLVFSEYQGWDTAIQVQNLSAVVAAKVKVYFLDVSGGLVTTMVDWICPRGSQTFYLPAIENLPGAWVGSARVESQEWFEPGSPGVQGPDVVGIAQLVRYAALARTTITEALAYNMLGEGLAYDWQTGSGAGGTESGVGLIAIPSLLKNLDNIGITSEFAITNFVPVPGFTDVAIYIYDHNGVLDVVCQKLNEKQVDFVDLALWNYVNPGFEGSAIISAVFWEHDQLDDSGFYLRNLVGLGAVSIQRVGTTFGLDVPGDQATGLPGFAFKAPFDFEGPAVPGCPGVPRQPDQQPGLCLCPEPISNGTIDAADPSFIRPNDFGQGEMCSVSGMTANFDLYQFRNCTGQPWDLTITLDGDDPFLAVYQPSFDPSQPCLNAIAANDDFSGTDSRLNVTVAPGPFAIVATSFFGTSGGSYTLAISGAEECVLP
jgi:uncharacterized repeat protein (TIGR01451 family)